MAIIVAISAPTRHGLAGARGATAARCDARGAACMAAAAAAR
eukprot:COSAG01_NODE_3005_length_6731_cov_34.287394_1_plen_41_part_10